MDSLRAAFDAYLQLVAAATEELRAGPRARGGLALLLNPELELHEIVKSLEERAEFKELVRLTRSNFPDSWPAMSGGVGHFFRRSGAYLQCLRHAEIDTEIQFAAFESAFTQQDTLVRYLAPLEFLELSRDQLDCDSFSIRRFSRDQLDIVLQTEVNRAFYPAANTQELSHYWFLAIEERLPAQGPSHVFYSPVDLDRTDHVSASYQPPPGPVERALQILSLFDWERRGRFCVPFVIKTDDGLLRFPYRWWCGGKWAVGAPDCSRLAVRQTSRRGRRLEQHASSQLEDFTRDIGSILSRCIPVAREPERDQKDHPWYFFELALVYLVRAFQTEGLEQLLWHMIAIEALVGGEPVRATIRHRLVRMLGSTKSEQKEIRNQFNHLYDLRSNLVHGNPWGTPESRAQDRFLGSLPGRTRVLGSVPRTDLADIRRLARRAILWFARWLDHEHRRLGPLDDPSLLPSREQLLSVLDFDEPYERLSRHCQQIGNVVHALPSGFPNVSEWRK